MYGPVVPSTSGFPKHPAAQAEARHYDEQAGKRPQNAFETQWLRQIQTFRD
jgi:hypothetical protein